MPGWNGLGAGASPEAKIIADLSLTRLLGIERCAANRLAGRTRPGSVGAACAAFPFPSLPFPPRAHAPSHTLSHRQTLARMRMRMRSAAPLSVELGARFDRPAPGSESLAPSAPCDPCAKPAWLGVGIRRVCRGLRLGAWLGGRRIARWGTVGLGASIQSHWLVAGRLEPMGVERSPAPPAQSARGGRGRRRRATSPLVGLDGLSMAAKSGSMPVDGMFALPAQ